MSVGHSKSITLVLIASLTAFATACNEDTGNQQLYGNRGDCLKDWREPRYCEQNTSSSYPRTFYYEPRYYVEGKEVSVTTRNGRTETVSKSIPVVRSISTGSGSGFSRSVTRGGFGGSASAHFGGGS